MNVNHKQLQDWCSARNVPHHLYHEEWIVHLFTISKQLKESSLSNEQKKDLRKQVQQILISKREECRQAYQAHNLNIEIPKFQRKMSNLSKIPKEFDDLGYTFRRF